MAHWTFAWICCHILAPHQFQHAICDRQRKSRLCMLLVAPYRAIPQDYLSDTPLLRAMGFLVSQHDQIGCDTPPPFLSLSPFREHAKWRCDSLPTKKGYLSDTPSSGTPSLFFRIPRENKAQNLQYPPPRYYLERALHDMGGGISHWAAKCIQYI